MKYLILLLTLTMGFGQTKLETRVYELEMFFDENEEITIDLNQITGYDLEHITFYLQSINLDIFGNNDRIGLEYKSQYLNGTIYTNWYMFAYINADGHITQAYHTHPMPQNQTIILKSDRPISGTFGFAITAEFPQDETPYNQADLDNAYYEGAQSGDVSGDGVLNVMDLVQYINMILDF